jgi:hypothetical protein
MANNPLQKFFRQPKIFISLPSKGLYNNPGEITGDITKLPVYGMTGMDEILIKTPDALITGESTVKVIESCCPAITNGWAVSNLDLELILAAIRIATYTNVITVGHTCEYCQTENEYELELSKIIDYYNHITFDERAVLKDVVVKLRPLCYKEVTDFSQRNFELRQQLEIASKIEDDVEKSKEMSRLYEAYGALQVEVYSANIIAIEAGSTVVDERAYINEWLANTEKSTFDQIKIHIDKNTKLWETPPQVAQCESCGKENTLRVALDHSTFFANA